MSLDFPKEQHDLSRAPRMARSSRSSYRSRSLPCSALLCSRTKTVHSSSTHSKSKRSRQRELLYCRTQHMRGRPRGYTRPRRERNCCSPSRPTRPAPSLQRRAPQPGPIVNLGVGKKEDGVLRRAEHLINITYLRRDGAKPIRVLTA